MDRVTGPSSSSSQALLQLLRRLLPPDSSDALLSAHFASSMQLLSDAMTSHKPVTEADVAEKIKKKLVRIMMGMMLFML